VTRIAVIPGDGIGVEVTHEAVETLKEAVRLGGRPLEFEEFRNGADHFLRTGETLPQDGFDRPLDVRRHPPRALGDPRVPDNRHAADILLGLRFRLDLYVNHRPVRLLDERLCR